MKRRIEARDLWHVRQSFRDVADELQGRGLVERRERDQVFEFAEHTRSDPDGCRKAVAAVHNAVSNRVKTPPRKGLEQVVRCRTRVG